MSQEMLGMKRSLQGKQKRSEKKAMPWRSETIFIIKRIIRKVKLSQTSLRKKKFSQPFKEKYNKKEVVRSSVVSTRKMG